MLITGIDPGLHGALAFLDTDAAKMCIGDMPLFEFYTTRTRKKVDPFAVARWMHDLKPHHVYLEDVASSTQQGVVSAFSFGEGKGILYGVAVAIGIPVTMPKPNDWKKQMRCPADKRATVQRASQLFPALAPLFKGPRGGVFDGRAEACLLALFAAMELGCVPTTAVTPWGIEGDETNTSEITGILR